MHYTLCTALQVVQGDPRDGRRSPIQRKSASCGGKERFIRKGFVCNKELKIVCLLNFHATGWNTSMISRASGLLSKEIWTSMSLVDCRT